MKSANFKSTTTAGKGTRTIYGTVTLKDNGKTSISLHNAKYGTSYSERYQAKKVAEAIVAADFNHEAVTDLKVNNCTGLVAILKEQTKELKSQFLDKTSIYATDKYNWAVAFAKLTYEEVLADYNQEQTEGKYILNESGQRVWARVKTGKIILSEAGKKYWNESRTIILSSLEAFVAKEVNNAKAHYNESIEKLALRLNQKGIKDDTKMEISTATINANITTTIKHEGNITKAWTIIASGPIQRPHYRYLVK